MPFCKIKLETTPNYCENLNYNDAVYSQYATTFIIHKININDTVSVLLTNDEISYSSIDIFLPEKKYGLIIQPTINATPLTIFNIWNNIWIICVILSILLFVINIMIRIFLKKKCNIRCCKKHLPHNIILVPSVNVNIRYNDKHEIIV